MGWNVGNTLGTIGGLFAGGVPGAGLGALVGGLFGGGDEPPPPPPPPRPELAAHVQGAGPIGPLNIDQRGMSAFRDRALSTGPSAWHNAMTAREGQDSMNQRENQLARGHSEIARGQDALAMSGGLTGGGAERLQKAGNQDMMTQMQNLGRESGMRRMDIGIEDERQRMAALGQLPGMEIANVQPEFQRQQFNANLHNQNAAAQNQANMERYGIDSNIWGSAQLAAATRDS
jgi:hypothetical protein